MKLNDGVFLHQVGNEYMGVTQGDAAQSFNGLIRNNKTANSIMELLMVDTTEEKVVAAMLEKYDAPREIIANDVRKIVEKLRLAGLLDE